MANPIIRPVPIYVNGDKVAEATEGDWDTNGGVALAPAADVVGITRGTVTVKCNFSTIVPVKGQRVRVMELCIGQADIGIEVFVDGQSLKADGVLESAGYSWNQEKGACTGKSVFIGAQPQMA